MTESAPGNLHVSDTREQLVEAAAQWLLHRALNCANRRFAVALSGGSTPQPLYQRLAQSPYLESFPWTRVHWFWGDERCVPADHPRSNYRMVREAMLDHAPVPKENIHPIVCDGRTAEQAAADYEAHLRDWYGATHLQAERPLFDVCLLGLGEDGHIASLLPGQPVLDETVRWVAAVPKGSDEPRISLTYPVLESSAALVFLAAGAGKREMVQRALGGDASIPAGRLRAPGECLWFLDKAAAG